MYVPNLKGSLTEHLDMDGIIIWTRKSIQKLQNAIFFKIFKIPFNGQLV